MATFSDRWEEFDATSRVGLVIGTLVIVAATLAAMVWLLRDEKLVLFSDLNAQDAAAIVAELERQKLDYTLAEGGTKILVPGKQVHTTRLKLMGSGMPMHGGVGFELFDDSDFGMTEFAQRINYQRAMQGELARTIMALDEVRHARVHLVMPEGGLFRRDKETPTASVNLVLQNDSRLSQAQVSGVQRLVAAAVQGLDAAHVTILDQHGVTLSKEVIDDSQGAAAGTRLARKQEVEAYLIGKASAVLTHWLGPGRAAVSVDVSLNMSQVRRTLENVMPQEDGSGVVTLKRESRNWGGQGEERTDGAVTTETQYDMSRRVEQIVEMPGGIVRLSVGVLVPGALTEVEMAKLEELVAMAVGLDEARGDSIALHAIETLPLETADGAATGGDYPVLAASMASPGRAAGGAELPQWLRALNADGKTLGPLPVSTWLLLSVLALVVWCLALTWRHALRGSGAHPAQARALTASERAAVADRIREWFAASERDNDEARP